MLRNRIGLLLVTLLTLGGVSLSGCGKAGPEPVDITGTATFDGQPIVYGNLELIPNHQMSGPAGSADIIEGKFDTRNGGRGVFLGEYRVKVTAYAEPLPPSNPDENAPSTAKPPLFAGFVVETKIQAEGNTIEVPASAKGFGIPKGK